jgi:hypothetical protein
VKGVPLSRRIHAWRFELLALALFAAYLAGPAAWKSTTLVYHRFLPPAWAIVAVCMGAGTTRALSLGRCAMCSALPIGSLLIAWPTFVDSNTVYSDLDAIVDRIAPGSAVLVIKIGNDPPHRLWSPSVAMGHIVALRGGRTIFDYTQSPVSPVVQRPEKQWVEETDRLDGRPLELRPAWDFHRFRYLAVVSTTQGIGEVVEMALRGDARLVAGKGEWSLFESTWPVVPIDSDEVPLAMPPPPTLRKKLKDVARELDAEAVEGQQPHAAVAPEDRSPGGR